MINLPHTLTPAASIFCPKIESEGSGRFVWPKIEGAISGKSEKGSQQR